MLHTISQRETAMTTDAKGALACLAFDRRAIEKGGVVSVPVLEARYDRILDWEGRLHRVQIKYCDRSSSRSANAVSVHLQSFRHRRCTSAGYSGDEVDAVVAFIPQVDALCWFGPEDFEGLTALTLRLAPAQNGQQKGIRLYERYLW
jgi:hypothetical protein